MTASSVSRAMTLVALRYDLGTQSRTLAVTCPAIGQVNPDASKVSMGVIDLVPAWSDSQNPTAELEMEESGPSPVMTTDRFMFE